MFLSRILSYLSLIDKFRDSKIWHNETFYFINLNYKSLSININIRMYESNFNWSNPMYQNSAAGIFCIFNGFNFFLHYTITICPFQYLSVISVNWRTICILIWKRRNKLHWRQTFGNFRRYNLKSAFFDEDSSLNLFIILIFKTILVMSISKKKLPVPQIYEHFLFAY